METSSLKRERDAVHCYERIDQYLRPMDSSPLFWLNRNCRPVAAESK